MKPNEELLQKLGQVRKKWKTFLWVRGIAWILGVLVVSLVLGLAIANSPRVPFWAVRTLQLGLIAAFIATIVRALIIPLKRTPTDTQLAQFIQEKNPGLQDRLVSAVEAIQKPRPDQAMFNHLLIKDTLEKTRNVKFGEQINKKKFNTFSAVGGALALALIAGLYFSSLFFPYALGRLVASPLHPPVLDAIQMTVTPGNQTLPKGSDVNVQAVLSGFDPQRAEIHMRYDNSTEWESATMDVLPQTLPTYRHRLLNLQEAIHYYVEADGHRSDEFTIKVADLPRVEKQDYIYHYPSYTGIAQKKEENATDMVALKGTSVDVVIQGSQPLASGRIVFADGKTVDLAASGEKQVMGKVVVDRNTTFRIELTNTNKQKYLGLEEYSLEALGDQKPIVQFTKPGRDYKATNLEEVFTELRADDDFGVNTLELHYSVNGTEEKTVNLFQNKRQAPKEISGSHTFFLEEYNLKPGDFVSYFGKAVDTGNPANTVSTDIYFVEVRPFGLEYKQGQAGGGGGGGGGGGQQDDAAAALSKRQKDIIAATFKLNRDKANYQTKEWTDNVHAIGENQSKLIDQAETMVGRLEKRGLSDQDPKFKDLTENIQKAIEQMGPAADQLKKGAPDVAYPYENKSLQYLSRVEALFTEIQVTQGQRGGGGGGGGRSAQDLADLFELELDQSKNQYETAKTADMSQQNSAQKDEVDAATKKLEELAQRQQKAAEQQARAQAGGGGQGDPGAADLQRETEKLARQLDTLSRQNNDPQMAEAAKALQQAAQNMQNQARSGNAQQQQQAAQQASDQLQRAQRLLNQGQGSGSMEDRLAQAQQEVKRLKDEQGKVANQTEQLGSDRSDSAKAKASELDKQQQQISNDARNMQQELQSLAGSQGGTPEAASKAREASNAIQANGLINQMNTANQFLRNGNYNYASQNQRQAEKGLGDIEKQIQQAVAAAGNTEQKRLQNALNQAGQTAQAVESLQRRAQDTAQQGQQGQGQQGKPGQQGQQQGQGQQAQQGKPGQGQQGQGQQGQQGQGQQGQQGQGQGQGQQGQGGQGQQAANQQGQGQGQGQQNGNNNGGGQNFGGGNFNGNPNGAFSGGNANRGTFNADDIRQLTRELDQRLQELQDIRRQLGPNNAAAGDLNGAINALQTLRQSGLAGNPEAVARLAQQVIDPLRSVELEISRSLQLMTAKENVRTAQEEDIPAEYQKPVEEYYKRLGK